MLSVQIQIRIINILLFLSRTLRAVVSIKTLISLLKNLNGLFTSKSPQMRVQIKSTCSVLVVTFFYLQSIHSHDSHGGLKPGGVLHDHEHETDEHKEYEKNVLLGDEEEGAGYDQLTRQEKVQRLLYVERVI